MFRSKNTGNPIPSVSIVASGMTVAGNIQTQGDVRVDGVVKGNLSGSKIFIGPDAVIEGDIVGRQADIMGRVEGKIIVDETLQLRGAAQVNGDIYALKLVVESSASFNGQCKMGANIVGINDIARAVNE